MKSNVFIILMTLYYNLLMMASWWWWDWLRRFTSFWNYCLYMFMNYI